MNDDVKTDVRHQDPVHPRGEFGFAQWDGEKYRQDCKTVGKHGRALEINDFEPGPLENRNFRVLGGEDEIEVVLTGEYVGSISDQPMDPVENRSFGRVRVRSESGENRLEKRQRRGDDSHEGVRLAGTGHPFAQFNEDARGPGQAQDPSKHHQQTVPLPA